MQSQAAIVLSNKNLIARGLSMQFSLTSAKFDSLKTDCLIISVFSGDGLTSALKELPENLSQFIIKAAKNNKFLGQKKQTLFIPHTGENIARVYLIGLGEISAEGSEPSRLIAPLIAAGKQLKQSNIKNMSIALHHVISTNDLPEKTIQLAIKALAESQYQFSLHKSAKAAPVIKKAQIITDARSVKASHRKAVKEARAMWSGMDYARLLANQPGNICHPSYLASQARSLAKTSTKLKVNILDEKELKKLGMNAFVSVSQGSAQSGKMIFMEYTNAPKDDKGKKPAPLALIGKGITFDTGGISLKPGAGMDEMKYDMGGAASVFGTMKALLELELPINVIAVVAAAENMPDGTASRPGDIVKTYSGQTVEILNTDAEGRLVLCDALAYTEKKYKPELMVDMATLTGACVIALGAHASAVYSKDDALRDDLIKAGEQSHDRGWPMPLWDDYQPQLNSPFADMANIGGRPAGSITAACFLSRFVKNTPWAHMDIAGTAWKSGAQKGATGRPVSLLTQFLINKAK